jgi:hypothetical protein
MARPSPSHAGSPVLVALGLSIRAIREKQGLSQPIHLSVILASLHQLTLNQNLFHHA